MRFRFHTRSHDNKLKGTVSGAYISEKLINRQITTVAYANDGTSVDLGLTGGALVRFILTPEGPEVQYIAP